MSNICRWVGTLMVNAHYINVHLHTPQSQLLPSQMPPILLRIHNRPCIITGGDSRRVSQKQAGVRTGVSSWLGQTGVKTPFVAPSVALVASDLTTRCAATLPITNSLRLLSRWDYRQFWVSTAVYLRIHCSGMLHCIGGYWFPTFWMMAVPSKHQGPLQPVKQCKIPEDSNPPQCFISTVTKDSLNVVLLFISTVFLHSLINCHFIPVSKVLQSILLSPTLQFSQRKFCMMNIWF